MLANIITGKYTNMRGFCMIKLATDSCAILCASAPKTLTPTRLKKFLKYLIVTHINRVLKKSSR